MFCGDITTGASNDIERATNIARGMVYEWGMDETMGPVKYTEEGEGIAGPVRHVSVSEQTRRELDERVRAIMDEQYAFAENMIRENKDALIRIAEALLEHETLDAKQVFDLIEGKALAPESPAVAKQEATEESTESLGAASEKASDTDTEAGGMKPSLA